jgi:hypothetical protein
MKEKVLHDRQCTPLTKLDQIAEQTRVDLDLLRITLAYIAACTLPSTTTTTSESVADANDFHPDITDVKQMVRASPLLQMVASSDVDNDDIDIS